MSEKTLLNDLETEVAKIKTAIENGDYSINFERFQKKRLKALENHIKELKRLRK